MAFAYPPEGGKPMADGTTEWVVAVNACPYCGRAMADRTDDDYRLAARGMGGAWSEEFQRITTGYWFLEYCPGCGKFLSGVEYQPEPVRVEFRPELPNELVFDRWVAWYGLVKGVHTESGDAEVTMKVTSRRSDDGTIEPPRSDS